MCFLCVGVCAREGKSGSRGRGGVAGRSMHGRATVSQFALNAVALLSRHMVGDECKYAGQGDTDPTY